jgi:hypothetical protein
MLDWEPATGNFRIWNYDSNATQSDPLPGPQVVGGNWQSIRTGHELAFLSAVGGLLDWEPATGHYRILRYDKNVTNGDPFPTPPLAQGNDSFGILFAPGRQVTQISRNLLSWSPASGDFVLLNYLTNPNHVDLLSGGVVTKGKWQTIGQGHTLIDLGLSVESDNPRVLDWVPATGGYRIWRYDAQAINSKTDPLPGAPIVNSSWDTIRSGHHLVYLGGDRVLDWVEATGRVSDS